MPAVQHFAEHAVGVIAALVSALAILVVDPRVHDHLAGRVVAEEQPVLLEKLRAEPMLVVAAKRPTLAVLRSRRVLRDDQTGRASKGKRVAVRVAPGGRPLLK